MATMEEILIGQFDAQLQNAGVTLRNMMSELKPEETQATRLESALDYLSMARAEVFAFHVLRRPLTMGIASNETAHD